jgi:hypothetical protein
MALSYTYTDPNTGIVLTYWVMGVIQQDIDGQVYRCSMKGYPASANRTAGNNPVETLVVLVAQGSAFQADLTAAELYALVQAAPGWSGATIVS